MRSNRTKQIINEIANEEGISDQAVWFIVNSQFEGVNRVITSGVPDKPETFKSVRLNAFGLFQFKPWKFKKFMGRKKYEADKRRIYDRKR